MSARVLAASAAFVCAASLVALVLLSGGCGKSKLAKAYGPYNAQVEKLLDAEYKTGKSLEDLFRGQYEENAPDFQRYADFLTGTALPFYDRFVADATAIVPGDPGLEPAQKAFVQYATARQEFARVLAANLDALRLPDSTRHLKSKIDAAETTKSAYADTLKGDAATPDPRFTVLSALAKDFQSKCLEPMARGETTHKDVGDYVRKQILPEIAKLRESKYDDDEPGRRLRDAVAAAQEFYVAIIEDVKPMESRARLARASEEAAHAADEAMKKLKEELATVRRKM